MVLQKGDDTDDADDMDNMDSTDYTIGILPWDRVLSQNFRGNPIHKRTDDFLGFRCFQELRCPEFNSL